MKILVFGAGSLGSLIGGMLARVHDVTMVGRKPHMRSVRDGGLVVEGKMDVRVTPNARTTVPASASVDLAIVTVKSFDTSQAARALVRCEPHAVLSLQNGLGNERILSEHLDGVLAGTCTYGATYEPGRVRCTGVGEIVLGPPDGGRSKHADRVASAFEAAGLIATVAEDMPRRLWEKLAVNTGINAPTALARIKNGELDAGPATEIAETAARETAHAARQEGIDLTGDEVVEAVRRVIDATADNTSSMLQDVRSERPTEIDAINGYVAEYDDTPVNTTLAGLLRAWEHERGLR
ncbi:ketopantoate reductase family protein [Halocatena salina]|uniref:2-dehydropantoate 2-reductase n=1 Tax=Halocatena salina TaxID=2934340 RepID=A0A8U0A059_9EURY|nr:ketopantoate reductase family protein [Halocatena salina]UPM42139.1 ketopantoate reductase family protein [Halocatena salina]